MVLAESPDWGKYEAGLLKSKVQKDLSDAHFDHPGLRYVNMQRGILAFERTLWQKHQQQNLAGSWLICTKVTQL